MTEQIATLFPCCTKDGASGPGYAFRVQQDPQDHAGRYVVSGNSEAHYLDAAETVLINKKGVTELRALQLLEEEGLANAYELLLTEVRTDTPLTCDLLLHINHRIFGDLYPWAGRWRTVRISKPGVSWPPPDFLDQAMRQFELDLLQKHPAGSLSADGAFCQALGHVQGEFLAIHPFREGNARTIKLATDLLSSQTGRPLLRYDKSDQGRIAYIAAAKSAMTKNFEPMTAIIREALAVTRRAAPGP